MNLRGYSDLAEHLRNKPPCQLEDIDLIVGIPRSGLMVSLMVGMAWKKPITDVAGALDGRVIQSGTTTQADPEGSIDFGSAKLRVLLIDDSCHTGSSMRQAQSALEQAYREWSIETLCAYVSPRSKSLVDYYFEVLPPHHVFEWNIGRNIVLEEACVDIDGVLCPDPRWSEESDEDKYLAYIKNAPVLLRTYRPIKYLVTNRLESRRSETEAWLASKQIRYGELIMHPAKSIAERALRDSAWHKSKFYSKCDAHLFIESEVAQAEAIWARTKKPVLCFETFAFPAGKKQVYKTGLKPFIFRNIKKLAPIMESIGRDGGVMGFLRHAVVKRIKRNVI